MPLPPWNDQLQHRMVSADRTLKAGMQGIILSLRKAIEVRDQFIALGLSALWPRASFPSGALEPDSYVHLDRDASTQAEQSDLGNFIVYARGHLLDEGTGTTTATQARALLTPAQAAAILKKYAG